MDSGIERRVLSLIAYFAAKNPVAGVSSQLSEKVAIDSAAPGLPISDKKGAKFRDSPFCNS
jgi:hypothetical protein